MNYLEIRRRALRIAEHKEEKTHDNVMEDLEVLKILQLCNLSEDLIDLLEFLKNDFKDHMDNLRGAILGER